MLDTHFMEISSEISPKNNLMHPKGNEVVILSAYEMGFLRKILIENQGRERAKGVFTRFGWACGYNEALSLNVQSENSNLQDLVHTCCFMQATKGQAKIESQITRIDNKTKSWLHKGRVTVSCEAQQYIQHFIRSENPVCWHLMAFMGGFGSALLGEKVYYKETKCIGKGDPYCEFVGKSLKEWDNSIESELPYYEEKNIRQELDAAHSRIKEQSEQLQRSFLLHQQLSQLVLSGVGLDGIVQSLAEFTRGEIFIFDNNSKIMAFHSTNNTVSLNRIKGKMYTVLNNFCLNYYFTENNVFNNEMTHQIDLRVANERCKGLAIPIVGVGSPMGYVSIMYTNNKEIDKDATLILQQTAAICALVILKQKEITNLEQQFRWDFADQLISNMYSNEDSIIAWGSRLGYDITKPHRIITMAIEYAKLIKLKSQEEQFLLKKNILSITNNHLKKAYPAVICADVKNNLAIFLPEKTTDHIIILNICNTLKKEIEIKFPKITILVGIGGIAQSCQDYSKKLLEADKAVHILKSFKKKDSVLFYDDLGSLSILFEVNKKQDLLEFMNRKLGPLIEYDYKHNSELIKSLDDYLTTDSLRKTANNTAISLSGLKYRLNKIKEFGYNLNSPQERFDLQLALQIFKVTQL